MDEVSKTIGIANDTTKLILYHLMNMDSNAEVGTKVAKNITSVSTGHLFFSYFTLVIVFTGVIGNVLSVFVFMSANMRKLAASTYLAALSFSDTMSLLTYVLVEWLQRALPFFTGEPVYTFDNLIIFKCQMRLYFSYVFRFLSAWLIVAFTIERFIAVCYPLKLMVLSSVAGARRNILSIFTIACIALLFKPVLSGVYPVHMRGNITLNVCTSNTRHERLSFILDVLYSCSITVIPVFLIIILNISIIRKIVMRRRSQLAACVVTSENVITLEFTVILLFISFCFVGLNIPYFSMWCLQYFRKRSIVVDGENVAERSSFSDEDSLIMTRTIFFLNYCINFFLYCITGAYFRRSLKLLFRIGYRRRSESLSTNIRSKNSWL